MKYYKKYYAKFIFKVYPNSWGALNTTKIITREVDLDALKNEIKNSMLESKLVASHDLNYRLIFEIFIKSNNRFKTKISILYIYFQMIKEPSRPQISICIK